MKAVVTHQSHGLRMFLTPDGYSSDIKSHAKEFLHLHDATVQAWVENQDRRWTDWGIHWQPAMLLHNGEVA